MRLFAYLIVALIAGCGGGVSEYPGTPVDSAVPADSPLSEDGPPEGNPPVDSPPAPETRRLGMNDVSLFFPLSPGGRVIGGMNGIGIHADPVDLVPRSAFSRLVTSHVDIFFDYEQFELFSMRFDLCDRIVPGPCPERAVGSLRVVFQPNPDSHLADVALHAFYVIPAAEVGVMVNQLRGLARVSNMSRNAVLGFRSLGSEAQDRIKALVIAYARADRLIRLSVMGQDSRTSESRVIFRGIELQNGEMVDMTVATTGATQQTVSMAADADPGYVVTPVADSPAGFALALSEAAFNAAAPADQRSALEALVATQNPLLETAATVQCIACHTSSYLGVHRGQVAGIDITNLTNRYTSTFDLGLSAGVSATEEHSMHAFSWFERKRAISQRVANETAQVIKEIEERFPVP